MLATARTLAPARAPTCFRCIAPPCNPFAGANRHSVTPLPGVYRGNRQMAGSRPGTPLASITDEARDVQPCCTLSPRDPMRRAICPRTNDDDVATRAAELTARA